MKRDAFRQKIKQIIPAEGWRAVYFNEEDQDLIVSRIIAWALIDDDDENYVTGLEVEDTYVGFVADGSSPLQSDNFYGYISPDKVVDEEFRKIVATDYYAGKERLEQARAEERAKREAKFNVN